MRDWIKVWRPRQGSAFDARVSAPARMLFRGMLALLNDDGVMHLPASKHLHYALGKAIGYGKDERRVLKKQVAELVGHGCIKATQDDDGYWTIWAPSWRRFQAPQRGEKKAPAEVPPSAAPVQSECTAGATLVQSQAPKCPESHTPNRQEEKRREETPPTPSNACADDDKPDPKFNDPLGELESVGAGQLVTRLWVLVMRELGGGPYDESLIRGTDRQRLGDLVRWGMDTATVEAKAGKDWARTYFAALRGSLIVYRDEYQRRPDATPLSPGGWWARRDKWRQAA